MRHLRSFLRTCVCALYAYAVRSRVRGKKMSQIAEEENDHIFTHNRTEYREKKPNKGRKNIKKIAFCPLSAPLLLFYFHVILEVEKENGFGNKTWKKGGKRSFCYGLSIAAAAAVS